MKKLPDEKVLDELLVLAKNFEQQALSLYEQATIDENGAFAWIPDVKLRLKNPISHLFDLTFTNL
jgi:hypothetical protein